ncbi:hypothetical protein EOD39_12251 [Acipenser ruthenus]|uniref:Uncharacterized protein n=1 Tax=Acipenser ruthenus TaxID=7906 RepID=A0A662YT39_ACIRT|nr:hypothetical protein EOD39_12251 [Acipenser ruthenus]
MFGKYYQDNLLKLIWKYLDLDPHHKLLYIGESGESFIPVLEKTSALLQPVVWGEECGAPHTDKKLKRIEQLDNYSFDRVLLVNAVQYFQEEVVSFEDRLMFISAHKLSEEGGAYPSIQRSGCVRSTPPHSAVWDLPLKLPLTEDLIKYLHKPSKPKLKYRSHTSTLALIANDKLKTRLLLEKWRKGWSNRSKIWKSLMAAS